MRSASTRLPDVVAMQRLCQLVQHRYGIQVADDIELRRKLGEACHQLGYPGLGDFYIGVSRHERGAVNALIEALTTNHTGFYREVHSYHRFIQRVVPTLPRQSPIRVWSAASSSGEELYTLAFFLIDTFGLERVASQWQLLGTDINDQVIQTAERGVYSRARVERIPQETRERYLHQQPNGSYQIHETVRKLCVFRRLNLLKTTYPFENTFHVIFCRNVLYYFTPATQVMVLRSLHRVAHEGGWLLTGVSESIQHLDTPWQTDSQGLHRREA